MPCPEVEQVLPQRTGWRHFRSMAGREALSQSVQEGEGKQLLESVRGKWRYAKLYLVMRAGRRGTRHALRSHPVSLISPNCF